jgi:MFS family permease
MEVVLTAVDALRERDFRWFFAGQAVSDLGDKLVPVALAFAVLDLTGSASALGLVLLFRAVPNLVFLLAGGVWADRLPRHHLMLGCNVVRGLSQGLTAALLVAGHARLWELCALAAVYGTADAFFGPATTGLVQQIVTPGRLQQANALQTLSQSSARVVGPAIAGVIVATAGAGWAIAIDSATFFVGAVSLAQLAPAAIVRVRGSFLRELAEGWREVVSRSWIWVSIVSFAIFQFACLAPYIVLGPVISRDSLGGASAYAAIMAAAGAGSVLGGVLTLLLKPARPLRACFLGGAVWALVLLAFGLAVPVPVIAVAAAAANAGMTFGGSLWFTSLQQHVPRESISRVSSYDWMGSMVFLPLGFALAGPLADAVGAGPAMIGAACVCVVVNLGVAALPSVRTLGRAEEDETVVGPAAAAA